jgi:hypothetical protein
LQQWWEAIAVYRAGIVPVRYRRVPCRRTGGVRFTVGGHSYFELVTVANVGGSGVVAQAWVRGARTRWMAMARNWGANWQSNAYLNGQSLSFRLRSDDGRVVTAYDVAPARVVVRRHLHVQCPVLLTAWRPADVDDSRL